MNDLLTQSFSSQLVALESCFLPSLKAASPDAGFIQYVFATLPEDCRPAACPTLVPPPKVAGGIAPELATLGFLSAVNSGAVTTALSSSWRGSFGRLQNKDPFPVDRLTFTLRPIEFLGICVGAQVIAQPATDEIAWLRSLLPEQRRQLQGRWSVWLSSAANVVLSGADDWRESVDLHELGIDELALLTWLRISSVFAEHGFWRSVDAATLQQQLLTRCATATLDSLEPTRAALVYAVLKFSVMTSLRSVLEERWQATRSQKDALELVTLICRRFHRMAHQIRTRHSNRPTLEIGDEYDVQDLMHGILLLFFDDVREETWTGNYAGTSSRTDFVLWKESVVVEIKMTRKTLTQAEIANQLIIDKERYRADARCKTLICFVYDPVGWCKNPAALETDLEQDNPPRTRVVVFSGRN